jgi:predicted NodU family carbamoyl transferase
MFDLLTAFKARTGYGVLCNTSLNFNGKGFINRIDDLDRYVRRRELDGFVLEGRAYLRRDAEAVKALAPPAQ